MARTELRLVPTPKKLSMREGVFDPAGRRYIKLETDEPQSVIPAAKKAGLPWEITASPRAPKGLVGLTIRVDASESIQKQGYKLAIRPDGIEIVASDPSGAFYGACTLAQILRQQTADDRQQPENGQSALFNLKSEIPCLSVLDAPDFPVRGVMLDISRDKVPTMETLFHLVDLLADWKINQLQLYTEHTFAYLAHPSVWEKACPMTGEQIMELDAYCRSRFIELVPNQNSFGHMERWLRNDKYRPMAEAPYGCDTVWGRFDHPFSLCPGDRRVIPFVRGLYDELLPHFTSPMFNVGCDETVDLGRGRSEKACKERGVGRVYLDFILQIHQLVKERGRIMQFWGDIIIKHPELIPELPKEAIALEWGYEADHPFAEHGAQFGESGSEFYVCPGTSSWNTIAGRTENCIENIRNAARNGHDCGAIGLLNTDWGDNGHWQPLSVSYLGFMVGAAASWNTKPDAREDLARRLSIHAFGDPTGVSGKAFHELGNIYLCFSKKTFNASVPWQMLFRDAGDAKWVEGLETREFEEMERRLDEIETEFAGEAMCSPDAEIVREEFEHLVRMLRLSAEVGKHRLGGSKPKDLADKLHEAKMDHEVVWLMRNRSGGLADSESKLKIVE